MKEKDIKVVIKQMYEGLENGPVLLTPDGNVVKEKTSSFRFVVKLGNDEQNKKLIEHLKKLKYSIDFETKPGLTPFFGNRLVRIDVANKRVGYPLIVSVRHFEYLRDKESILVADVLNNFDELIINKNKALANSLCQWRKNEKVNIHWSRTSVR